MQLLCADVSQSGGLGVTSSEDGKLWVWDTDTGEARVRASSACMYESVGGLSSVVCILL